MTSDELVPPQIEVPPSHLLRGQLQNLLFLAAMLPGAVLLAEPSLGDGAALGLQDRSWLLLALGVPIVQQLAVSLVWRLQLATRLLSRLFGRWDLAVWGAFFLPLLVARPLTLLGLGIADAGSLGLPRVVGLSLAGLLALPAVYTLWSVMRYFGIPRALGGDHFRERYRVLPPVREGAFAWTDNAMYGLAFLGLWALALATDSRAALAACLFQHAWILAHWYCTEAPDLELLHPD